MATGKVQLHAAIDRIEAGRYAVVLVGTESVSIDLPLELLPEGVKPGDHLIIEIAVDEESGKQAENRIRDLQEKLEKRSNLQDKKDFTL
jgi:hypothetical protein